MVLKHKAVYNEETKREEDCVMRLSEKILNLRKQNGLSQEELAEKMNVSRQAISRWEGGSAQPDVSNILQLSKLFGVTTDFLLNEEYQNDNDMPVIRNRKIKKMIALCISIVGLLGNFIFYVLSRFVEVMIPRITYKNGQKWYHWTSELTGHSYKYFVQEYNLEVLTVLCWCLFFAGMAYILINNDKIKKILKKHKQR